MLDLALSILCSSFIFVVFKLFSRYKVQTLYAIIMNYIVASFTGFVMYSGGIDFQNLLSSPWFWQTFVLGILFIVVFNIMAKSSQVYGVGVTSVATKMSLIVPVVFALLYYGEVLSTLQVIGVLTALVAVYLATLTPKTVVISKQDLWLPILVFLGSGIIDTSIKYIQEAHLKDEEFPLFSATVFGAAACSGILFLLVKNRSTPFKTNFNNVFGGIFLGIPNYFSIYFLLRALKNETWNSASIFTLNNISIVLLTTLLGIVLFRERLGFKNWLGVALAVASIIFVALF